jgi:lipopolysaccharide export LptBFGC system permease protein LptF
MSELTPRELKARIERIDKATAETPWRTGELELLRFRYSMIFALPCASLAVALFAIAVMPRRRVSAWLLGPLAFVISAAYFGLFAAGNRWAIADAMPIVLGAWLPNLVFGALAGVLYVRSAVRARFTQDVARPRGGPAATP